MVLLRGVCPRKACDPGSFPPSYASTSVIRSTIGPSSVSCTSSRPSRSGATSRTGLAKKDRGRARRGAGGMGQTLRRRGVLVGQGSIDGVQEVHGEHGGRRCLGG